MARHGVIRWLGALLHGPYAALLGLAIPQTWMYAANQQVIGTSVAAVLAFYLAFAATLAASALAGHRVGRLLDGAPVSLVASSLAAAALTCTALISDALPPAALLAACCLGGIGGALLFQQWFSLCCRVPLRDGVGYVLLSFALAAFVSLALDALAVAAPLGQTLALAALVLASPALASRLPRPNAPAATDMSADPQTAPEQGTPSTSRLGNRQLVLLALELVLFSLALGLLRSEGAEAQETQAGVWVSLALRAVVALLLFWLVGARASQARLAGISQVTLVIIAVAFIALALVGEAARLVTPVLASLARNIVLILLTVTLLYVVHSSGLRPSAVYGAGRGVHAIGTLAGIVTDLQLGATPGLVAISANAALLIIACTFLALGVSSTKAVGLLEEPGDAACAPDGPATTTGKLAQTEAALDERCLEVAQAYALTDRESEMVRLICRGRSRSYIAESLGISENTVRFHVKGAYAKLGIHSKQELLTLIGIK